MAPSTFDARCGEKRKSVAVRRELGLADEAGVQLVSAPPRGPGGAALRGVAPQRPAPPLRRGSHAGNGSRVCMCVRMWLYARDRFFSLFAREMRNIDSHRRRWFSAAAARPMNWLLIFRACFANRAIGVYWTTEAFLGGLVDYLWKLRFSIESSVSF